MRGRAFTPHEDWRHGGKVVVLSYGLWQRRFGGDATTVGKSLSQGNELCTIVGVVGKRFLFSTRRPDIWLPFQFPPVSEDQNHYFLVAGILKPGLTVVQANAQLMAAAPQYRRPRRQFAVEPLRDSIVGGVRNSLLVLRQCCQSAAGARHGTQARVRHPRRSWSRPRAHCSTTPSSKASCCVRLPFADSATLVALGHVADGADSNGAPNVSASQVITLFP